MKVALLICTYNRPEYLKQCLWSINRANLTRIDTLLIADDASTDKETLELISHYTVNRNEQNIGIKATLLKNIDALFQTHDIVINLDGDAVVRPEFVTTLLDKYVGGLLTGFHCITKNANGTERHKILRETENLYIKQSVGGINFCFDKAAYTSHIRPALLSNGNWDNNACISAGFAYCLKQSVVQHIGFNSSMGHTEQPDIADDFYYWDLPSVTLLGVDSSAQRLNRAKDICTKWIRFGDVVTLNPTINSKEAYSKFILTEAFRYVNTDHCLIFQHDGFVNNFMAWDNSFLQYDYIGAPWYYKDGMSVGNGGFSLRSRRLMDILATDPEIKIHHPEDHHICRTYRPYLENTYDIKFAPLDVAERFSFEGYMQPGKFLKDQFGRHGMAPRTITKTISERFVINQFRGLGDILFLVPLVRFLIEEGHTILWPISPEYYNIAKHFPDINFVSTSDYPDIPYNSMNVERTPYGRLLPYRFAMELRGTTMRNCMRAKYDIYHKPLELWRNLKWKRDYQAESKLAKLLKLPKEYILVNNNMCQPILGFKSAINVRSGLPLVNMQILKDFSLIDWHGIIEGASEIHTVNTSLLYMLEVMDLNMPIHLYRRGIHGELAFEHTDYLHTKDYILH